MRKIHYSMLLAVFGLIAGCGPIYTTDYIYHPPKTIAGKQCLINAENNKLICQQNCNTQRYRCEKEVRERARYEYEAYVSRRNVEHKPIKKSLRDFEFWSSCNQNCGCNASYMANYQLCGGKIDTISHCVAFCDKAH